MRVYAILFVNERERKRKEKTLDFVLLSLIRKRWLLCSLEYLGACRTICEMNTRGVQQN